ncbi:RagB/SusD family nutrient uptake outer membrane protein [Algoriphagus zhangzhouensis]|uniref:Starch-binding associating with outer membrane n=1 Tax=Algoriphagus zhangzhouensis TaxID=1073327 RepID=A0A1M7ZJI6_9BACT|nr:RagB/SusD family nutrient uptake outer membrane protein [Algoriphagus zhangzhouensis]TDY43526.1 putative outer membrane starch-binding protein [Algoriphagus zhangzhouensis]SHO65061.1 Starch-binding associating with outer membrane [Algoriphagus zhangzhouensis]
MNNFKIKIGALLSSAMMMVAVSCSDDFLEVPPTGLLAEAQLTSLAGIEASLIAAYSQVNGRGNRLASPSNWVWGSIRGGEANKGTDPGDFSTINPIQRFEVNAASGNVGDKWNGAYEGIARCNNVLRLLQNPGEDVTESDQVRIAAQARFLRAHYYFELKKLYGDTPYVDENVDYGSGLEDVSNNQDLYPFIEADFQYAIDNLPATQGQVGRVNSWAAKAYLAKVYLYEAKYSNAKTLFDDVIANGVTSNGLKYDLVPYYEDMFRGANDNHQESVWAYQSAANTGSVNNANPEFDLNWPYNTGPAGPGNCCGFFQPTFSFVNAFRTDANGLPLLDKTYNDAANRVKNDMGIQTADAFTPDAGNLDPRLDHTVGRRGLPYLDWQDHPGAAWIRNQPNGGPYSPKKYVYTRTEQGSYQDNSSWTPGYTGINFMIIRFADVLLMSAEADIETGNLESARAKVNRVRERAMNSKLEREDGTMAANYVISTYDDVWTSADAARTAVRMERMLELGMEGHRFYDLVRWNTVQAELDYYFALDGTLLSAALGGASFTDKHKLLPIPQDQIDLVGSDILIQNPGF